MFSLLILITYSGLSRSIKDDIDSLHVDVNSISKKVIQLQIGRHTFFCVYC
jgi:hypothetical protein